MPTLATFIQHSTKRPSQNNQARKIKGIHIEKEEVKLSLFADDIIYVESPKDSTKKLLELTNEFSKVAGYYINIQKPVAFLCTRNKLSEKENNPIHNVIKKNPGWCGSVGWRIIL